MPTTAELWPPALASVTHQCPPPHPRGPPRTPRNLSFTMLESVFPPRASVLPWSSAVEGQERAWTCDFPTAGSRDRPGLCSATLEEPGSLEAPWCPQEEPRRPLTGRLSPSRLWILPFAKAEGSATHCLPPAPRLHAPDHACLRTKACTVCTPFAWPLISSPVSLRLPEEGRTRFLLLVLTPL